MESVVDEVYGEGVCRDRLKKMDKNQSFRI